VPKIGRIKLSDTQGLVAFLVDNEKLDFRIFIKSGSYIGARRKGFRFCLFDNNWVEFTKLNDKIDKAYNEIG